MWSEGFPVYEGLRGVECRGCGARIMSMEHPVTDEEVLQAGLPLDCDEAVPVVVHEDYKFWDGEDLWEDSDVWRAPVWPAGDNPGEAAGAPGGCPDLQRAPSKTVPKDLSQGLEALEPEKESHK